MRTTYFIKKMDCSAEEQMIRMRLAGIEQVEHLTFDLSARRLIVEHTGNPEAINSALDALGLGARQIMHEATNAPADGSEDASEEKRPLVAALAINAAFFVGEFTAGLLAGSMGLLADSLDMLADALVYALSLMAVGGPMVRKKQLARYSGYLQLSLAVFGLAEVTRRFVVAEDIPDVSTMIIVAVLALAGNVATLIILNRARRGEAHVEASWIFTSNDIKVNGLVIVSGLLVAATASRIPDLIAGALIFIVVARGARRILALAATD